MFVLDRFHYTNKVAVMASPCMVMVYIQTACRVIPLGTCSHCLPVQLHTQGLTSTYVALHVNLNFFISGPIFGHSATTQGGSSGCPIFREFNNRWIVVGLHHGELPCGETMLSNFGTHMSVIYDAFKGKLYSGQGIYIIIM